MITVPNQNIIMDKLAEIFKEYDELTELIAMRNKDNRMTLTGVTHENGTSVTFEITTSEVDI